MGDGAVDAVEIGRDMARADAVALEQQAELARQNREGSLYVLAAASAPRESGARP